jgi:sugar/nucleoside kinase (ribokinase family)
VIRIGVIGAAAADTITLDGEPPFRRPGGTPVFAERALRAVGAEPVTFVIEPPVDSRLVHDGTGTSQEIRSLAAALTPARVAAEVLPRIKGCSWVVLGGQTGGEFPPAVLDALAGAGHHLLLDAQGLARGERLGPVQLGPFPPDCYRGVRCLKLNRAEARAAFGGDDAATALAVGAPEVLLTLGPAGLMVAAGGRVENVAGSGLPFHDPTGAGDSLSALYCLARSHGAEPVEAARGAVDTVERLYGSS